MIEIGDAVIGAAAVGALSFVAGFVVAVGIAVRGGGKNG